MSLSTGTKLAHYEILEPIGKGGMGEVYRARDGKLGREVAIKVLPEEFARDGERLARFKREAKVLASLNHPNIASIYGLEQSGETHYLVLEMVPGATLAERIARGPIPVAESIDIANAIAVALEEAHDRGIVHRDLKPANVKITPDGKVIVLDFGLAKAFVNDAPDTDSSVSPTRLRQGSGEAGTQIGVILGTAAYMSPEQAKGKRVGKGADVWAFGALLYEMLTGRRAFVGEDVSDTLAAVLRAEPEWAALPEETPPALRRALRLCLTKDSKLRLRDIGDARLVMGGAFESNGEPPAETVPSASGWRTSVLAGLLGLVAGGFAVLSLSRPAPRPVTRLPIPLTSPLFSLAGPPLLAISPDGRTVAYAGMDRLYRRDLERLEAQPIPNTEGANTPFFSPDGQWLGFQTGARGALRKVSLAGGPAVTLAETSVAGASWGPDGSIVLGVAGAGLSRVPAAGGEPEPLTFLEDDEVGHYRPDVLPSGRAVLFTIWSGSVDTAQIAVVSLDTGERRTLVEGGTYPRYAPTGHIVFARDDSLWAIPFDDDRLEVTGSAVPVVEGVWVNAVGGAAQFALANNGTLVYATGGMAPGGNRLVWVDRRGREELLSAEPREFVYPRLSPDGRRVALDIRDRDNDIWIWEFGRGTMTRLTFDPANDVHPIWAPDGTRVAFASDRDGVPNLYWKKADGTGIVERLSESSYPQSPQSFSPDGAELMFTEDDTRQKTLGRLMLGGTTEPIALGGFSEVNAELSPDGRFLAYQSNESGRQEIYVRPFPDVSKGRWQVSAGWGTRPLWAPDGRELFYLASDGKLMSVPVQTDPGFAPGNAEVVIDATPYYRGSSITIGRTFDISGDGERFLMIKMGGSDETSANELILVQNWFEELKRLVPTDN